MDDAKIVQLYWDRNEQAIPATADKYGRYCTSIAKNILGNNEDAEELSQHDVIDEDRADDNGKIRELHTYFLRNLLNNAIRYPSTIKAPGASTNTNGM